MALVKLDELTEGNWEFDIVILAKRIESQRLFQTHYHQSKAQRIQTRIQELEVIGQSREPPLLFCRNLLKMRRYGRSSGHLRNSLWIRRTDYIGATARNPELCRRMDPPSKILPGATYVPFYISTDTIGSRLGRQTESSEADFAEM
jgi:hypothetical protein